MVRNTVKNAILDLHISCSKVPSKCRKYRFRLPKFKNFPGGHTPRNALEFSDFYQCPVLGNFNYVATPPPLANDNATPLYSFPLSLEHVSTHLDPSIFTRDGRRIINFVRHNWQLVRFLKCTKIYTHC